MPMQHDVKWSNIRYFTSCNKWFAWEGNNTAKRFVFNLKQKIENDIIKVYAKQQA